VRVNTPPGPGWGHRILVEREIFEMGSTSRASTQNDRTAKRRRALVRGHSFDIQHGVTLVCSQPQTAPDA
jgi:hypothetical protein